MMDLKNKKVAVFGLGASGQALVKKLVRLGARVAATDIRPENELKIGPLKKLSNVIFFLGGHPPELLDGTDLIVLSPGLHPDLPVLETARTRGIPVIGEVELAYKLLVQPIIAITGTNGKSTTAVLTGALLNNGRIKTRVAGNIGYPLVAVNDRNLDFVVAEISSYQLESIREFNPLISVILNITPDHVERHHGLDNYVRTKARIFENHSEDNFLIYNSDDRQVKKLAKNAASSPVPFSLKGRVKNGIYLDKNGWITSEISGKKLRLIHHKKLSLSGRHNVENFMAAAAAAQLAGVAPESIKKTLATFPGLEHRIELVREINGVKYYNDSKGTNPDSTIIALRALGSSKKKRLILIAGGRDKGTDLADMIREIKKFVRVVILIGEAAARFDKELRHGGFKNILHAASLKKAVVAASVLAGPKDAVLLSPAAASFDMFNNFEHRGRVFKSIVRTLKGR